VLQRLPVDILGGRAPANVTVCGKMCSNLGNGVELRVTCWNDDVRHEVLATFNTLNVRIGRAQTFR
jgi:hypothetical protein